MLKKRLLVTISFSFSIRYLYRTGMLHQLRNFADVVIAITWNEENLIRELKADGFEVHLVPESKKGVIYETARKRINYWFTFFRLKNSLRVQEKYLNQFSSLKTILLNRLRGKINYARFLLPGYTNKIFKKEREALVADTNFNDMLALVDALNIDAVLSVTPFHAQEDILLRACKHRGKQMLASILSFDNITKRGWMPVIYDTYMVWNKYNHQQTLRIYKEIKDPLSVHVVGAAQFDFYYNDHNLLSKQDWMQLVGIPGNGRKIILYAGGPGSLFPNEPQYLKHILEAIDSGEIQGDPLVLFRCHPVDNLSKWKNYIGAHENLVYDISWTGKEKLQYSNITTEDIKKLCSTLAYTDVHINLCSTMTVDGSAFRKPQIGPNYDEVKPAKQHLLQGMYQQEHFMPIIKSRGLLLAGSKQQFISLINSALTNPELVTQHSQKVLEEIITYTDSKSTGRVVDIIKKTLKQHEDSSHSSELLSI